MKVEWKLVAALLFGFGTMLAAIGIMWTSFRGTTQEGYTYRDQRQREYHQREGWAHEEAMAKLRIKEARVNNATGNPKPSSESNSSRSATTSGGCSPGNTTSHASPFRPDNCLATEHRLDPYWVVFPSGKTPAKVEGVIWFEQFEFRQGGDGKKYPNKVSLCIANETDPRHASSTSPDQCKIFLRRKADEGVPLFVTNRGPVRITY